MQKLLAVAAVLLMAMPANAIVVIDTAANDVVIARDAGETATATATSAPLPSSIPDVDPFALAIPVLLVAILLLRGGRLREPRPVIACPGFHSSMI
ncbi:MAG: hypothetical protein ACOYLK_11820 [Sphingomonas sp.]